jgi:cytochrome c-type biogenesis protein CcmE
VNSTRNLVIMALFIACGTGLLIWAAMDAQWVQTVSAQDVLSNPAAYKLKSLQIFGKVVPDSIKEKSHALEFDLYWPKQKRIETGVLHIRYAGLTKVNLIAGSDVLIECRIDEQGQVTANKILTKCPSKYTSRENKKEGL